MEGFLLFDAASVDAARPSQLLPRERAASAR
jgi:hypothetical protein